MKALSVLTLNIPRSPTKSIHAFATSSVKPLFEGKEFDYEGLREKHPNIKPTIPMDQDDPLYDVWKLIRDNLTASGH